MLPNIVGPTAVAVALTTSMLGAVAVEAAAPVEHNPVETDADVDPALAPRPGPDRSLDGTPSRESEGTGDGTPADDFEWSFDFTIDPGVSADDQLKVATEVEGPQRLPTGGLRLTSDPAGLCGGMQPTIVATGVGTTFGTDGDDVIVGTPGNDTIMGLGGWDTICGFDGNDTIYGEDDNPNTMVGGRDTIFGGMGHDDLFGGPNKDTIFAGPGEDYVEGDLLGSQYGAGDVIFGGNDDDHLIGGKGADGIVGDRWFNGAPDGYGNDTIDLVSDSDGAWYSYAYAGHGNDTVLAADGFVSAVHGEGGVDTCDVDDIDTVFTCE